MTFYFFLPEKGIRKTITLCLIDKDLKRIFQLKTGLKILETDWDKKRQRPKNIYLKRFKKINKRIENIKIFLSESIQEINLEDTQSIKYIVSKKIKEICEGHELDLPKDSLLYYMQQYIQLKEGLICNSTLKRYKVFFNLIERFEGVKSERLYVEKINGSFIRDFLLFGKEEEYSENTIYRTIHFVKTILNFAERKGIRTAVRELEVRRERQQRAIVTLSEQEIRKIKLTDVPKELQHAKDWLIISCYTGQRFSDFINFNSNHLKMIKEKICISFIQKKTKKHIIIPLHPSILEIISRDNGDMRFPKYLDIQQYNSDIKIIAKLANIDESIKARKRIGFRTKNVFIEKWDVLSSHVGRRSFATNFYGKIPTPLLMEATGHSTEQMFLNYINPINYDRILSLNKYFKEIDEISEQENIPSLSFCI